MITLLIGIIDKMNGVEHHHAWYQNHLLLAFYGWLVWNVLMFSLEKDKLDAENKRFNVKRYFRIYYDNMLVTAVFTPILVVFANDLWIYLMDFLGKDFEFSDIAYLGIGVFVTFIYWIIKKFAK